MLKFSPFRNRDDRLHYGLASFLLLVMAATILTALGLQYLGGYIPCKLCLEERLPYYIGLPLMAIVLLLGRKLPVFLIRLLFLALALIMLYNVGLSIYHAGAEWKFWPGPSDCTTAAATLTQDANRLLDNLDAARPVSCDEAGLYFLGLSLAGWNGIVSLFLAIVSTIGAFFSLKKDDI